MNTRSTPFLLALALCFFTFNLEAATPPASRIYIYSGSARVGSLSVVEGSRSKLTARALDSHRRRIRGAVFSWSSSATRIATVNSKGTVTCRTTGRSTIAATFRKKKARLALTCTKRILHAREVSASMNHGAILAENGEVWSAAMLFTPGTDYPIVKKVPGLSNITKIDCGPAHCYALNSSGVLYSFGMNWTTMEPLAAETVPGIGAVKLFAVGGYALADEFVIIQKTNGQILNWGNNEHNQFGNGGSTSSDVPIENDYVDTDLAALAAGDSQGLSLNSSGTCKFWGHMSNYTGDQWAFPQPLVHDHPSMRVTAMSAGGEYDLALLEDGSLWAFGHMVPSIVPEIVSPKAFTAGAELYFGMMFVKADGSVWTASPQLIDGTLAAPELYTDFSDVELIDAFNHAYVIRSDGALLIQVSTHTVPYVVEDPLK